MTHDEQGDEVDLHAAFGRRGCHDDRADGVSGGRGPEPVTIPV